jgi:hypothetical protein
MGEICASGSVGGEGGNILAYPAPDVWLIEPLYLAAPGHEFASTVHVDRTGVKVGTIQNSPSDRILTRTLKSAELVRLPLSPRFSADAVELLRSGEANPTWP